MCVFGLLMLEGQDALKITREGKRKNDNKNFPYKYHQWRRLFFMHRSCFGMFLLCHPDKVCTGRLSISLLGMGLWTFHLISGHTSLACEAATISRPAVVVIIIIVMVIVVVTCCGAASCWQALLFVLMDGQTWSRWSHARVDRTTEKNNFVFPAKSMAFSDQKAAWCLPKRILSHHAVKRKPLWRSLCAVETKHTYRL